MCKFKFKYLIGGVKYMLEGPSQEKWDYLSGNDYKSMFILEDFVLQRYCMNSIRKQYCHRTATT